MIVLYFKCQLLTLERAAILILRIYAMYGRSRALLWTLLSMLLAELVTELVIAIPILTRMTRE